MSSPNAMPGLIFFLLQDAALTEWLDVPSAWNLMMCNVVNFNKAHVILRPVMQHCLNRLWEIRCMPLDMLFNLFNDVVVLTGGLLMSSLHFNAHSDPWQSDDIDIFISQNEVLRVHDLLMRYAARMVVPLKLDDRNDGKKAYVQDIMLPPIRQVGRYYIGYNKIDIIVAKHGTTVQDVLATFDLIGLTSCYNGSFTIMQPALTFQKILKLSSLHSLLLCAFVRTYLGFDDSVPYILATTLTDFLEIFFWTKAVKTIFHAAVINELPVNSMKLLLEAYEQILNKRSKFHWAHPRNDVIQERLWLWLERHIDRCVKYESRGYTVLPPAIETEGKSFSWTETKNLFNFEPSDDYFSLYG